MFKRMREYPISVIFILTFLISSTFPVSISYGQRDIRQTTTGPQSPAVVAGRDVIIKYGISDEDLRKLLKDFGLKDKVIERLLKTLEEKDVTIEAKEKTIQEWINKYQGLEARLAIRSAEDTLSAQAKKRLDDGDLDGAERILEESLNANLNALEEKRKAAAADAYELGSVKELKLDYRGARGYYEKAVEIEPQNSDYLYPLGGILIVLGESQKAIEYLDKALAIRLKVYGEQHPDVATCYNNIGRARDNLGEYQKAIEYYDKALAIRLKVYGEQHPHVANCYNNIGAAWKNLGEYQKAIEYLDKALAIYLKVYGEQHPYVAACYINIGAARDNLGEYQKAIEYYDKALAICLKVYGEQHPYVATCYNNIGAAWKNLGESKKAIEYLDKALAITTKVFGAKHPETKKIRLRLESITGNNKDPN